MHVVIAAGRLKPGVTEAQMLAASDRFQREFVATQPGVVRRTVVGDDAGGYADIVVFTDAAAIEAVVAAEATNPVCLEFLSLWEGDQLTSYRVLHEHS